MLTLGRELAVTRPSLRLRPRGVAGWLAWVLGGALLLDVVLASAPPTSGDALAYHLNAPKLWLAAGRMTDTWWDFLSMQPFAVEMHFSYAQALSGGRAAMIVGAGFAVFSVVCLWGLVRELAGERAAWIAAALWTLQGMFVWEATGGFVELMLAALVALAAWHLVVLARGGQLGHAAWAGLAAGLAASCKVHALALVVLLVAGGALIGLRRAGGSVAGAAVVVALMGAAACVALPWYVKNWVVTGNPVYPLFSGTLGGRYWEPVTQRAFAEANGIYGVHGIWRFPFFPLEFLVDHGRFERGWSFSAGIFALAPAGFWLLRRASWARLLAAGFLVYALAWFEEMNQITRYLLPVLPFATVLAAAGAVALWERRGPWRPALAAVAVGTAVPFAAIAGLSTWRLLPGALGTTPPGVFVQRLTGTYDAFRWIDANVKGPGRILVGDRNLYWLDRPYTRFSIPLFLDDYPTATLVARMRAQDVRWLAFFDGVLPRGLEPLRPQLDELARLPAPEVTSRTLGTAKEGRKLVIYAWIGAAAPVAPGSVKSG